MLEPPPGFGILILPRIIGNKKPGSLHLYKEHIFVAAPVTGGGEM
jgi:hypothetical protein